MEHITPQELSTLMLKNKINLVDVRKNYEVEKGIIKGAIHIPMSLVNEWLPKILKVIGFFIAILAYVLDKLA